METKTENFSEIKLMINPQRQGQLSLTEKGANSQNSKSEA